MRLVGALLFVTLTGTFALAEDAKPAETKPETARPKVPLRLVKVLPDTHQVLLFDKTKGKDVVAEVGESVEGYAVTDIDDDEVSLDSPTGAEIVLTAPWYRHVVEPKAEPPKVAKADPQPADPYADAAPQDPYGEDLGPRASDLGQKADPAPAAITATATAPAPAAVPATVTVTVPAPAAAPAPAAVPVPAAAPAPAAAPVPAPAPDSPLTVSRSELTSTLSNFTKLSSTLHATFTPTGARLDSVVDASLFFRAGLRTGDVITAVDNQPLRSLDDAANLYARAGTARNVTVHVLRADKPISLHIAIQ